MSSTSKVEFSRTPLKTIKVDARGETFRIVQLQGNLMVCSKEHGNCCCGWTEKGRAPINYALYQKEWEDRKIRNKIHLTFTGCLGPCATGNNVLLQLGGRSIWFKDLNEDSLIPLLYEYVEALLKDITTAPPPELEDHIFERFLPSQVVTGVSQTRIANEQGGSNSDDLEGIDPVCLMEVDPATAKWSSEYEGRKIYFCAPSCKKSFDKDPLAYL